MAERIRTDETIAKDVIDSLSWDSRVDASHVSVTVDRGIVTLTGTVSSYSSRMVASEDAWLITGARKVENQLKVVFQVEVPSDDEIKTNIEHAITSDNDLYPYDIQVDVVAGSVTLGGTVDEFSKKVRVEDMASRMRGVVGVTNKIVVVLTDLIEDEILAETIINALDRNVNVNVDDINVAVENGTVFLNGTVPNGSAKRAAYDTARYTLGVKEVKDHIIVSIPVKTPQG
jgi:osmotically-inducible protein OsmY